jgi:6-phospho-3-hexuloisomerase
VQYGTIHPQILDEIRAVLDRVDEAEVNALVEAILGADKVFLFAVGRVRLALECLGKRLGHLGVDCQIVGAVNEKPITPRDLLLVASGSGESQLPVQIARIAKERGARLALITSARASTLQALADVLVYLPTPTKNDPQAGVASQQPLSTLFDQSLHLFGDVVATLIQEQRGLSNDELWKYHANLE